MNEVANYLEQVKVFQAVSPEEAKALMDAKDGGILFIGRESCPYCRRFVAKLSPLAQEAGLKVAYLHSQNPETLSQVQQLRDQWQVPTVPGFLFSDNEGVHVKCDSSLSPEEILAFVMR